MAHLFFGALALDDRADGIGGGPQRIHFHRRPLPFGPAVIETNKSPPLLFEEDWDGDDGLNILGRQHALFAGRELAHQAIEYFPASHHFHPAGKTALDQGHVLHLRADDARPDAPGGPFVAQAGAQPAIGINVILKQVNAAHFAGIAQALQNLLNVALPGCASQELLGGKANCLQHVIAPAQRFFSVLLTRDVAQHHQPAGQVVLAV